MNPKNALFLSATLTAFVLAVLFGVVTRVTTTTSTAAAAAPVAAEQQVAAQPASTATQPATSLPEPTAQAQLGPEEAATLAAAAIQREDVYSVETSTYQGAEAYKVVFSSGDIVFIGLDRQMIGQSKLQATVITVDPTQAPKKKNNKNNNNSVSAPQTSSSPSTGGDDNGGEDHKEDDHDEDKEDDHDD